MTAGPGSARAVVCAVVVTRDRRDLLAQSLAALAAQTRAPDRVLVVDNASSDGTADLLRDRFPSVQVVRLEENQGATGGFAEGIATGCEAGAEWLWLLDDDAFPAPAALAELLAGLERVPPGPAPALMAGRVEWRDGRPHPMNVPTIQRRDATLLDASAARRLLPLRATTWVSLLLSRGAAEDCAPPDRRFFYQADDIEYTARILRHRRGYYVPASVVEHRTPSKQTWTADENRFFHHARNTVFMLRGAAWSPAEKPALTWSLVRSIIEYVPGEGAAGRAKVVLRSLAAGFSRLPA